MNLVVTIIVDFVFKGNDSRASDGGEWTIYNSIFARVGWGPSFGVRDGLWGLAGINGKYIVELDRPSFKGFRSIETIIVESLKLVVV